MLKAFSAVNNLLGAVVSLAILALLVAGGWLGLKTYLGEKWEKDALAQKLAEREAEVDQLQRNVDKLQTALKLLKTDHRVARIDVLDQSGSRAKGDLVTSFSFAEVDDKGKELEKPRVFTIKGDEVHVEALVVKFTDESIEEAAPFRSTSLCLFKRVYGEEQKPIDGWTLDPAGAQPAGYRTGEASSEFEKEVWSRFWEYSNNPDEARKKGIRAIHGEGPFQKVAPGKRYRVLLRSSGGLSFETEDLPAKGGGHAY